ncbi:hypothetical protein [Microbacterium sp.]|uniref:hypothetical protein n=1 Tax=Microbacterium sp. TaxID=51671 RepID=UPI003C72C576
MAEPNDDLPVWSTTHTHLFPGARLTAAEDAVAAGDLAILFRDEVLVPASVIASEHADAFFLAVDGYTTRAGTAIPEKRWTVTVTSPFDGSVRVRASA